MKMNAMQEEYQTVELFGNPALYSNGRIDRSTVPEGWYAYDLRGSDYDPGDPVTIEDHVVVNHAATILTQTPIRYPEGKDFLPLGEELNFADSTIMTLTEFCEENGLPAPASSQKYTLHPAHSDEAGLFYGLTPEQDEELGAIGHLRIDFGNNGREWWSSWHPRGPQELNTSEFRLELDELVNELRRDGSLLHDLRVTPTAERSKVAGGRTTVTKWKPKSTSIASAAALVRETITATSRALTSTSRS